MPSALSELLMQKKRFAAGGFYRAHWGTCRAPRYPKWCKGAFWPSTR